MSSFTNQKGLSLDRLQTLCLVAEKGGVMAASAGNANRQSLFSRQLRELEAFFGAALIDRSRTPHSLTPLGQQVEQTARGMFRDLEGLVQGPNAGRVPIICGAGESVIQSILIPSLTEGVAERSFCLVSRNLRSTAILAGLRNRRLDLGIAHDAGGHADLRSRRLLRYSLKLISRDARLTGMAEVGWADLEGAVLALPEEDTELRRAVEISLKESSKFPPIGVECTSHAQVVEAAMNPSVVGIVPDFVARHAESRGLHQVPIRELAGYSRELRLLWHPQVGALKPQVEDCVQRLVLALKNR